MKICNACRYCEGFCAMFPAMEKRRSFSTGDLEYLANLCHNCTSCFHSCQYAPPQEFDLNNPRTMAELRVETYQKYVWPGVFAGVFQKNGTFVSLITLISTLIVLCITLLVKGKKVVFTTYSGPDSFYNVISYESMVLLMVAIFLFVTVALWISLFRFARGTGWNIRQLFDPELMWQATMDVVTLRYLGGFGDGCNNENEVFSNLRRWMHQAVFFGFMLCVISTTVAAIYDHIFHLPAPYGYLSIPVVTGTIGGIGIMIGTAGLLFLKVLRDKRPFSERLLGMDVAFSMLLFMTSASGLLLLALRETSIMGLLLAVHVGLVVSFFLVLPFSKFVHGIYRFAALVRYADEDKIENPFND